MREVKALLFLALGGCGGIGGVTGLAIEGPESRVAVGSHVFLKVSHCLEAGFVSNSSLFPCKQPDRITVTATTDGTPSFVATGVRGDLTAPSVGLDAKVAGKTVVTVTATTSSKQTLTATAELEAVQATGNVILCLPTIPTGSQAIQDRGIDCGSELAWLPGWTEGFKRGAITDSAGASLNITDFSQVDYQVSGSGTFPFGGRTNSLLHSVVATGPGEIKVEPVAVELQAATPPIVFQVASPNDVAALRFATKLYGSAGELLRSPELLPSMIPRPGGDDGGTFRKYSTTIYPLAELVDGGFARSPVGSLRSEVSGTDAGKLACSTPESCNLNIDQPGLTTFALDVPPRTLRLTLEFQ